MTSRRVAAAVLTMLLCAGVNDAEAQAGGWRGWLDKLSGPGEFRGWELSVQPFCYGVPKFKSERLSAPTVDSGDTRLLRREWGGVDVACGEKRDRHEVDDLDVDLWRVAVGFEFGRSTSAHNPLDYGGAAAGDGPKVTLSTLVSAVDFAPNAWLEVGAGGGFGWFSTAGYSTTWKPLIQPLRVSVRPVTLLMAGSSSHPRAAGILQVKFNLTSFPGGFDASDFGAIPGSWQAGAELLKSFSLVLDFGELIR